MPAFLCERQSTTITIHASGSVALEAYLNAPFNVQDFTGIGNVVKFPAGVLITIPEQRVTTLQSAVGGKEQKPRAELILGAAANTKVQSDGFEMQTAHL